MGMCGFFMRICCLLQSAYVHKYVSMFRLSCCFKIIPICCCL
jgi:hypothetical protein